MKNNTIAEKTEMLRARISLELKDQFEQLCKKKGMSVSEYLRFLILNEIEKNK